ncbi:MAG: acetyl-CoA carboxylase biotin carboxylase subunit [Erysipelotrichaceae bacterium]|jgi:acetyl-CoA carboxylase biotin carboxylase subunit|nr:acetyl-CoA carboxylase biotin carboxylase subunit [Erysipelotrichaceae bacterium]
MLRKICIANRGEIAVRIIRACKDLGIKTVAIYSEADKDALHVHIADEAVCVGKPSSKDSYLNINNIISAATLKNCDAIHPGFGFLSENAKFARLVEECGMIWIGPNSNCIDLMGNKINARRLMKDAKVPIIPGSVDPIDSLEDGLRQASTFGYPLMIKAAAGGGGRGIRIVNNDEEFRTVYPIIRQEAKNYFNDESIYIEKLVKAAKHIEVQIMADKHGHVLHLFERDCSFQRRHQKVIEEAPCHYLSAALRQSICSDAVKAAQAVNYDSVGTVEFLLDDQNDYYFMEMNTRIQVEHPVTEMITGIDLIKNMIRAAGGGTLPYAQEDIKILGHAIECRINAEDFRNDFKPSAGKITFYHAPGGKDVRIDSAAYNGYTIVPFYDSMIAKLICFGDTRLNAIKRMRGALEEFIIDGIDNNIEFCYFTMFNSTFISGRYTTDFAAEWIKELKEREHSILQT